MIGIGDTVYQTDGIRIYESTVRKIIYDTGLYAFDASSIGYTVFLSRDEAEKEMSRLRDKAEKEANRRAREW
ncbi:MAG: hypothetical protein IKP03_06335 [Fibrobacter sp.]|nr:hypothetical protein [Clostridia bacterium]MBR4680705.1 hypothetical protein [Fibrobacter sp.]